MGVLRPTLTDGWCVLLLDAQRALVTFATPSATVPDVDAVTYWRLRPRCEWPGCGARAARCDLDHDLAWPHGPTCGCNLGPLCRRHHRIKQLGWTKQRTADNAVRWTSPTGRNWTSPTPHRPPEATAQLVRPRSSGSSQAARPVNSAKI